MSIRKKIEIIFLLFIVIQPILDLLTTYSTLHSDFPISVGTIVRFLALLIGLIYIITFPDKKLRNTLIVFLSFSTLFVVAHFITNILYKNPFSLVTEVTFTAKSAYLIVMLFTYICIFKSLNKNMEWKGETLKYLYYAAFIVGIIFLTATLSHTGLPSYSHKNKEGTQAWFYAANEVGVILSCLSFLTTIYALDKCITWKKIYYWVPFILLIFAMLALGTKVSFLSGFILLIILVLVSIANGIRFKRVHNFILSLVFFVAYVFITPYAPIAHNTNIFLNKFKISLSSDQHKHHKTKHKKKSNKTIENDSEDLGNVILSDRDVYLKHQQSDFQTAPLAQKLFGTGYGGNYKNYPKIIEMDFYDIFYGFGIIGFIVFILPLILLLGLLVIAFFRNFKEHILDKETIFFGAAIGLSLGIAFFAGHVLFAPAVSIYLAIMLAYLSVKWKAL